MVDNKNLNISSALAASRGIAVFIAVLWHVDIHLSNSYPLYQVHGTIFKYLWYIPLPLFFYLLGISFSAIIQKNRIGLISAAVGSYVYIYIVWVMIYHIIFYAFGQHSIDAGVLQNLKRFFFPAPELWFILWMPCCIALCMLTHRVLPIGIMIALVCTTLLTTTSGYKIQNFLIYNLTFTFAGVYTRQIFADSMQKYSGTLLVLSAITYVPIAHLTVPLDAFAIPALAIFESVIGIILIVSTMTVLQKINLVKFLASLGRNAFQIYLISPLWIIVDLQIVLRLQVAENQQENLLFQESAYILTAIVMLQSLVTTQLIGKKNPLLNVPMALRKRIEYPITQILSKFSAPSIGVRTARQTRR